MAHDNNLNVVVVTDVESKKQLLLFEAEMYCRFLHCVLLSFCSLAVVGCGSTIESDTKNEPQETEEHVHVSGDELVWLVNTEEIPSTDHVVSFGHHGSHFHGGDSIEPAVAITVAGEDVDNAKVTNQLFSKGENPKALSEEVSLVYEPKTEAEIAHYAQAELKIPSDSGNCVIRFKVTLEGTFEAFVKDVALNVGH